jgi:hypothetical protein
MPHRREIRRSAVAIDRLPPHNNTMPEAVSVSSPSVADVTRIVAIENPVVRNLQITECYADLAAAMRARTGGAADWCTFATWASRQAGSTIRGEDLLANFNRRLGRRSRVLAPLASLNRMLLRKGLFQPQTAFGRIVAEIHSPFDAFERASAEVARGNLKVFAEIGREFARFLASVPADARDDSVEFRTFAAGLRAGPPPDGQDLLRDAFACYQRQRHEPDVGGRAAWILLANLQIGFHEQTRLQPQIAAAVDAPLATAADLGGRVLRALFPGSAGWPAVVHGPAAVAVGGLALVLRRDAVRLTRAAVTESMMVLSLPGTVLSLGRDLDAPVPECLAGAPRPVLADVIREYDPCPPGGTACAATDWCDLRQRMHYITHLFRAYAETPSMFSIPFRPEQVAAFRAGRVPEGEL